MADVVLVNDAGDDTIAFAVASVIIGATPDGGAGDDTLTSGSAVGGAAEAVTIIGGTGADIITGSNVADRVLYTAADQGGAWQRIFWSRICARTL